VAQECSEAVGKGLTVSEALAEAVAAGRLCTVSAAAA
jgi:hypothetical protein